MDTRLADGAEVIQAYYSVLNARDSALTGIRFAALAAVHYLRPLGRSSLGLSCGLKGNGMCFAAPVIERFAWQWFTLAEDVEFHLALVGQGVRVVFAPETSVLAEMPVNFTQAASQNARWEQGRLQMLRERVPSLVWDGLRRRSAMRIDAAVEQLIPPLSVPFALGWLCLVASLLVGAPLAAALAAVSLAGQMGYLLAGLMLVRAPRGAYLALAYTPLYVLWKFQVYGRAMVGAIGARNMVWIRTARTTA
jgi:cellulose synthase/poly-beta-1,6-N-acetylglucosamine synthase-like glycosyltransferase